ncbi:MAG: IS200/IS605 family transposase [bacterium]
MHSVTRILVHAVFSTKYRNPLITDEIRGEMHKYMGGILRNLDCSPILINSVVDHAHLLFRLSNSWALAYVIKELKKASSQFVSSRFAAPDFRWQVGYFAVSVDDNGLDKVYDYIADQQEHHKETSFKDELEDICKRYGIEFNIHAMD